MHEKYSQKFLYISNWSILQIKYKKENFKLQKNGESNKKHKQSKLKQCFKVSQTLISFCFPIVTYLPNIYSTALLKPFIITIYKGS